MPRPRDQVQYPADRTRVSRKKTGWPKLEPDGRRADPAAPSVWQGELLALRWDDVDFYTGTLRVREAKLGEGRSVA